jgi:hypothetical protein
MTSVATVVGWLAVPSTSPVVTSTSTALVKVDPTSTHRTEDAAGAAGTALR